MFIKLTKSIDSLTEEILASVPYYLKEIDFEDHIIYHRSPYDIKHYDHSHAIRIRKSRNTHDNSVLGLWASTRPYTCRTFGDFNYKVNYKSDLVCKGINLRMFFNLTASISLKEQLILRKKLLENCDVLYIIDASQEINEIIILNTDEITINKVSNEIPDKSFKLLELSE